MEAEDIPQLKSSDIIIAVLGITGSGKSTFVSVATGLDVDIGHGLLSCTVNVGIFGYTDDKGRRVFLVDIPGFNDTLRSDLEILRELAFFFRRIHMSGASLGGIIYLQPITANRVQGSSKRSLRMLEQLCGLDALSRVVLCSSMWNRIFSDTPQYHDAVLREKELADEEEFWGYMLRSGSHLMRFDGSAETARASVKVLCDAFELHGPITLQVQKELSGEDTNLLATSAAKVVSTPLDQEFHNLETKLAQLETARRDQAEEKRKQTAEAIQEREQVERKLQEMSTLNTLLQERMDEFYAAREAEYNRQQELAQKLRSETEQALKDNYSQIQTLEEEEADNEEEYQEYVRTELGQHDQQDFESTLRHDREPLDNIPVPTQKPEVKTAKDKTVAETNAAKLAAVYMAGYKHEQQLVRQNMAVLIRQQRRSKMKALFLQNALPVLQILGGVACIAVGFAVPPAAPIIGAGFTIAFSGLKELKKNREERKQSKAPDQIDNTRVRNGVLKSITYPQQ